MLVRYMLSPCVRLFVTSGSFTKVTKPWITQTTPYDSPGTLSFLTPKISAKVQRRHPLRRRQIEVGVVQIGDFQPTFRYISQTVQDRDIVTMQHLQEHVCALLIGAISTDLE